jgi:nucleotide-binding universal stress UspA family protein
MYQHILIATDGSDLAQRAGEMGLSLAKAHRARVTAITASEPWSIARSSDGAVAVPFDAYEQAAASEAAKILASVGRLANQLDVECATAHVKEHPADGILPAARSSGCDLICRGLKWPTRPFAPDARKSGRARFDPAVR